MINKMFKQSAAMALIVLALLISKNSHIGILENGAAAVLNYMEVNYTASDVKTMAKKSKDMAVSVTSKVNESVGVIAGKPSYGQAIDEEFTGKQTSVYAVGGGEVTAVGENEEIGKYIKITHGDSGESLYGNLKSINVTVPGRVKKGDIIGVYEKSEDKEFYYSFREFE